ncbi:MAG: PIN domain-containing protein [Candidatus Aenigmarchaeota archaeon]|nr:PIN domain-containing protein [Candidatus Aenigmarchaeota archaeon]
MVCLETTFLIDLLRGSESVRKLSEEFTETEGSLAAASPAIMEVWRGAIAEKAKNGEKLRATKLFQSLNVLPLDGKSAMEAAVIELELKKEGITVDIEDIMIAAIARANGEKLVTRDAHYAKISGLQLIKY